MTFSNLAAESVFVQPNFRRPPRAVVNCQHVEPHGVISNAALPQEALRCAHKNSLFSPCHAEFGQAGFALADRPRANFDERQHRAVIAEDRKSTRLNSSHGSISYAVFCLKK